MAVVYKNWFGGAFFGGGFFGPGIQTDAGGDSTRLRRRGKRPRYFWEAALERKNKDKVAEAVFDAVADAYAIEDHKEFAAQVNYIRKVEARLREISKFEHIAEQVRTSLKELEYRAEMRGLLVAAQEEAELRELMELGLFD